MLCSYVCHNSFDTLEHVLHMIDFWVEGRLTNNLLLQGFQQSRLKVTFRKLNGRYKDQVCPYNLSLSNMLSDMFQDSYTLILTNGLLRVQLPDLPDVDYWLETVETGQQCLLLLCTRSHLWCIQGFMLVMHSTFGTQGLLCIWFVIFAFSYIHEVGDITVLYFNLSIRCK